MNRNGSCRGVGGSAAEVVGLGRGRGKGKDLIVGGSPEDPRTRLQGAEAEKTGGNPGGPTGRLQGGAEGEDTAAGTHKPVPHTRTDEEAGKCNLGEEVGMCKYCDMGIVRNHNYPSNQQNYSILLNYFLFDTRSRRS